MSGCTFGPTLAPEMHNASLSMRCHWNMTYCHLRSHFFPEFLSAVYHCFALKAVILIHFTQWMYTRLINHQNILVDNTNWKRNHSHNYKAQSIKHSLFNLLTKRKSTVAVSGSIKRVMLSKIILLIMACSFVCAAP